MSKLWNVYESGKIHEYEALKKVALQVVRQFPGLSASAFFEEVRNRFYPHPDECDIRGAILMMCSDNILRYTNKYKVEEV